MYDPCNPLRAADGQRTPPAASHARLARKRHVCRGGTKGNRVHAQHNKNLVGAIWYRQKTIIRNCDRGDELVVLQKAENSFVGFPHPGC
jgi:hypothetical protein